MCNKQPHKWHKEIKAWADGANIEVYHNSEWVDCLNPNWDKRNTYRIKPQLKPDITLFGNFNFRVSENGYVVPSNGSTDYVRGFWEIQFPRGNSTNFKVTLADDGTGEYKLKSMEVL